jgi:hypothetical protein
MPIAFPSKFAKEGVAVGRLLTSYSILEIDLMNCVQMGRGGDLNTVLKAMYGKRGANARIDEAEKLGVTSYSALGLAGDFGTAISAFRYCLKIRNQFAHWIWWDDLTGQVAFADLEELAKQTKAITDLRKLRAFHVTLSLLNAQNTYFAYVEQYLAWLNYEGRVRSGKLSTNPVSKPKLLRRPKLRLP